MLFPLTPAAVEADAPAYIDQLIDPSAINESIDPVYRDITEQPPGRRYLGTRLYHFREDREGQGISHENGLQVDWRRETYHYGELEATGTLLDISAGSGRSDKPSAGSLLTLRQHDFALNNEWLMQNSVGIDRTSFDPLLAGSYRFKLPTALVDGASTLLSSDWSDFRFGAGRLGRLDTGQVPTFDTTKGTLVSAGYSTRLSEQLHTGIQLVNVLNAETVEDHHSIAGVLDYRDGPGNNRYQGHVLVDSEGASGLWLDGDIRAGRWRHRFGMFRLGPDLLWTETATSNDMQGFYTRMDLQTLRYQLAGGLEFNTTDLENDPLRNGTRNTTAFLTGNRQLTRLTSIGGALNLRDTRSSANTVAGDAHDIRLTVHGSRRFSVATTRVQLQVADIENGMNHGHATGITWDQTWEPGRGLLLSSTLGHEVENGTGNDETRTTAGLLAWHDFSSSLRWDANINWTRSENEVIGSATDNVNAGVALLWRFLPGWEATLRASINDAREDVTGALAGTDFEGTERTMFLGIRRDMTSGRPFERVGRDTGRTGYGTVEGVVFYDENRDGIRQAGEAVAAGVYVYLDRRYQRLTDRDGRFEFAPVQAGRHTLSVAQEDLPLPWGLEDETPRSLDVQVRSRTGLAIPLVRIDG